jgi:phytoene dehydrogenase-like protein
MISAPVVVVIGAGHNGLACAAYLARGGRKVLVLEATPSVGGGAITREFHPGFRVSALAHLLHLLDPDVERELELARHGLRLARTRLRTVALSLGAPSLVLDEETMIDGTLSAADRAALPRFRARMLRFAATLARQHRREPPRLFWDDWRGALPAAMLALGVRRLGREDMQEFLRIITMPIHDLLEEEFESAQLKGALALDGLLGTKLGPRSGGTVLNFLHRMSGSVAGERGVFALPLGGMGAVSEALAAAARGAGVEIRLASPVASIFLAGDRVAGVRLATGEEIRAEIVVSGADPKSTLLGLLGARHLETEMARRVHQLRATGTSAKVHLALSALPAFAGVAAQELGERLLICPDLDYADRASNPAKYREYSPEPIMEITIPSLHDGGLAPPGQHVLSAIVQYAPSDLHVGWANARGGFLELVLELLERHAPGLRQLIVASQLLTPADIERDFLITGGHWHHAELSLDQFMMLRPVPGAAQYRMPVDGLYLCGAGCHPGGGVMGSAGRNAARAILAAAR